MANRQLMLGACIHYINSKISNKIKVFSTINLALFLNIWKRIELY